MTTCWLLTEDKAGMLNQCLGLAEALGVKAEWKRLVPRAPWKYLPPQLWCCALRAAGPGGDPLQPPWPDLLIATGRQTVAIARAIRRASAGKTFTVQIQNPGVAPRHFDLVVAPAHDRLQAANVIATHGALHRVTAPRLAAQAQDFAPSLLDLPQQRAVVLLGGSNRHYRFTPAAAHTLGAHLANLARAGVGLLITPSRRTDPHVMSALRAALVGLPARIWDGQSENPYFAYLGLADYVIVTGDSVNMVSEACSTGKPVYVVDLEGGSAKFQRFHAGLRQAGMTRPFTGVLEQWHYAPLNDTAKVAAEIQRRMRGAEGEANESR